MTDKSAALGKDFGQWEKHTKGVGLKLLKKFGFKGGSLGANESGISKPIEVSLRPQGVGIGFGDADKKTSDVKKESRPERKSISEKLAGVESWKKVDKQNKNKNASAAIKQILEESEKYRKEDEFVERKDVIIDMRYEQTRVISDLSTLNEEPEEKKAVKLGEELLHNLDKLLDQKRSKLSLQSHIVSSESERTQVLKQDQVVLEQQSIKDKKAKNALREIHELLDALSAADPASVGTEDNSKIVTQVVSQEVDNNFAFMVQDVFITLFKKYPEECRLYGLDRCLLHSLEGLFSRKFRQSGQGWVPMSDPGFLMRTVSPWYFLLGEDNDDNGAYSVFDRKKEESKSHFTKIIRHGIESMVERLCLPLIQRALSSSPMDSWTVSKEKNWAVDVISDLFLLLSQSAYDSLLSLIVVPKLTMAVSTWEFDILSKSPSPLISDWFMGWIPLFEHVSASAKKSSPVRYSQLSDTSNDNRNANLLSEMFPDIRRKLRHALKRWKPEADNDAAVQLISPWAPYFDVNSLVHWYAHVIIPKLVVSLKGLKIDPQAQRVESFSAVMFWKDNFPSPLFLVSLLEGEFFPKWLHTLRQWLMSPQADFGEITQWYLGWKSMFPDDLVPKGYKTSSEESDEYLATLCSTGIARYWSAALDMMSTAMSGGEIDNESVKVLADFGHINYELILGNKEALWKEHTDGTAATKKRKSSQFDHRQSSHSKKFPSASARAMGESVSFRDVVQAATEQKGVVFMPKANKFQGGKQLWQLGRNTTCYIDQDVLFVAQNVQDKNVVTVQWVPTSLDEAIDNCSML